MDVLTFLSKQFHFCLDRITSCTTSSFLDLFSTHIWMPLKIYIYHKLICIINLRDKLRFFSFRKWDLLGVVKCVQQEHYCVLAFQRTEQERTYYQKKTVSCSSERNKSTRLDFVWLLSCPVWWLFVAVSHGHFSMLEFSTLFQNTLIMFSTVLILKVDVLEGLSQVPK